MRKSNLRLVHSRPSIAGFSLIELMVAMAIGLFLVAGLFLLVANNSRTREEIDKAGRKVENGRFAMQRMSEDIKNAGFFGDFFNLPAPVALPDPCSTDLAVLQSGLALPIQGYADVSAANLGVLGLGCIPAADFVTGTNVLVVRFANPSPVTGMEDGWTTVPATLGAGQIFLQSNMDSVVFAGGTSAAPAAAAFPLTNNSAAGTPLAPVYPYITRIYFLGPCGRIAAGQSTCTASADGGAPVPSLRMVQLEAGATGAVFSSPSVAVANGIEVMEFDYGIDSTYSGGAATTTSGSVNSLTRTPTVSEFADVVSVTISLLARNAELSVGYVDDKKYVVGLHYPVAAPYVPTALNFKRHQFQMTVRVANTSMRREK